MSISDEQAIAGPDGPRGDVPRTGRFDILRRLGTGGMGVVYEAYDRERKMQVALKTLRQLDAATLYRFKNEFRALADLSHPNLVRLYELLWLDEEWLFTMELIQGRHFSEYVRPRSRLRRLDSRQATVEVVDTNELPTRPGLPRRAVAPRRRTVSLEVDLPRLRHGLRQLAQGVTALHESGKLHRDLKPPNVLVTEEGRVVLCDFGLTAEVGADRHYVSQERYVLGTPLYMSPEQAARRPQSEASDWYSVGVMLYEALTGEQPFLDDEDRAVVQKQVAEPPPPSQLVDGVPADLDRLCVDLLRLRAEQRPSGREVLDRLGARDTALASSHSAARPTELYGRQHHLAVLEQALATVRGGRALLVHVHGPSGMGKTSLVRSFLDEVSADRRLVVLSGRCYERESVPYKALDSLVDALSSYLAQLGRPEVEALLPPDIKALARVFPVLRRVDQVADEAPAKSAALDPQDVRLRAFRALRELLTRIAGEHVLVLHLDDLQWGDSDSAALLADLLTSPELPPLLLIASYRSENIGETPLVPLLPRPGAWLAALDVREIAAGGLTEHESRQLALALLGDHRPQALDLADVIAHESNGHPYLVAELVHHVQRGASLASGSGGPGGLTLERVIRVHVDSLPNDAQALLTAVAVAGRPVELAIARDAANLEFASADAVDLLRGERLVRTGGLRDEDPVECFHDRIRETIIAGLPSLELRSWHERLAVALGGTGRRDVYEQLAWHLQGAGKREQAGHYAEQAAEQAAETLAFERAARLYRLALELSPRTGAERSRLLTQLGNALAGDGRGAEAARVYLEAATEAGTSVGALELRRRAAEQFLRSGHLDDGRATLTEVLRAAGMRQAPTPARALASLLFWRARIWLRGWKFVARSSDEIPPAELAQIDILWSVASTFGTIDPIRGADYQTRHFLRALRAGDRRRISRGFAIEAAHKSPAGEPSRERVEWLCARARALGEEVGDPYAVGLATGVRGMAAFLRGEWRRAREDCASAEAIWTRHCTGLYWELGNARLFQLAATYYMGELSALADRATRFLREAEQRGDLFFSTSVRTYLMSMVALADDDPDGAHRNVRDAMARWTRQHVHVQHYYELFGTAQADLYAGDARAAWGRISTSWPVLRRALLFRVQAIRIGGRYLRARAALALAATGTPDARRLIRAAERDAAALAREKVSWARAYSYLARGGAAVLRGQTEAAAAHFAEAAHAAEAGEMRLHVEVARLRRGQLLGGPEGRALVDAALAWMTAQEIRQPARMAELLSPTGVGGSR